VCGEERAVVVAESEAGGSSMGEVGHGPLQASDYVSGT
jgi:hypothetical protein